jgi:hypothetical protein
MAGDQGGIEQDLIALEHARREAITRGDFDAVEGFLADTFYYAHINGMAEQREGYLERSRANPGLITETRASEMSVQPRGAYALMTGKSRIATAELSMDTLFLAVWERSDGGWKLSAYASTPLPTA